MTSNPDYFIDSDENGFGRALVLKGAWENTYVELMQRERLAVFRLSSSAGWKGSDIGFIANLQFLRGVEIYSENVKDISPILENRELEFVGLSATLGSSLDLSLLPNLRMAKVFCHDDLFGLDACCQLNHLNVVDYPCEDLKPFGGLTELHRLQISSKRLQTLRGIGSMRDLASIDLSICPKLTNVQDLAYASNLKEILLEACKGVGALPDGLLPLKLQKISIIDCGDIQSVKMLSDWPNLQSVILSGSTNVVDGDLTFAISNTAIQSLACANRTHYLPLRDEITDLLSRRRAIST